MSYCPRCKISVSPSHLRCPLCKTPVVEGELVPSGPTAPDDYPGRDMAAPGSENAAQVDVKASLPDTDPLSEAVAGLSPHDQRKVAFELISVASGFGLAVPVFINLFISHTLSWSLWSAVGVALFWSLSALPLIFWRRPIALFSTLVPAVLVLIACFDLIDGRLSWFPWLGGPLVLLVALTSGSVALIFRSYKRHGLNVLALFIASCAFLVVGIELILDLYAFRSFSPSWSIVTAFALIPTAGFLFYLHYRIVNRASLKKLFRL